MAKSVTEDLKKLGRLASIPLGKLSVSRENIVAVDLQIESITISKLIFKKKDWIVEKIITENFIPPDGENQLDNNIGFYVSKLRSLLVRTGSIGFDGAIIIPFNESDIYFFEMELASKEELVDMIQDSSFNDQFPEAPKELYNQNFDVSIIQEDEDNGTMRIALVIGQEKKIATKQTILSRAGLNPVIAEPEISSVLNSLAIQFGNDAFKIPTAFFVTNESYSYLIIGSEEGLIVSGVNFTDADRVLLLHVEDVEDVTGTVWAEVFSRISENIEVNIDEYNNKYKESKVEKLFFISNRPQIDNYVKGLQNSMLDLKIERMNPFEKISLSPKASAYISDFDNKSIFTKVIGAGLSRLNYFDIELKDNSFTKFNLLNGLEDLKMSRVLKSVSSILTWSSIVFFTLFYSFLLLNSFPEFLSNSTKLFSYNSIQSTHAELKKEHKNKKKDLSNIEKVIDLIDEPLNLPNLNLLTMVHDDVLRAVPEGLKFESMVFKPNLLQEDEDSDTIIGTPPRLTLTGKSIDDTNIKYFLQNLKKSERLYDAILQTSSDENLLNFTVDLVLNLDSDYELVIEE